MCTAQTRTRTHTHRVLQLTAKLMCYTSLSLSLSSSLTFFLRVCVCAISVSALFHMIRLMIWALSGSCYSCLGSWTAVKDARSSTCCGCNVFVIWNSKLNCRNARELWKTPERQGRDKEGETYIARKRQREREHFWKQHQVSYTSHLIRCLPLCFL